MSLEECRDISNFKTVCRICLVQYLGTNQKDLNSPISGQDDEETPLIFEALEEIMGEKIANNDEYPTGICDMCLGSLITAYHLKKHYFSNKIILEKVLASLHSDTQTFYESKRLQLQNTGTFNVSSKKELADMEEQREDLGYPLKKKRFYVIKQPPIINLVSRGVQTKPIKMDTQDDSPNVELLLGRISYDIKDILIVEDPLKMEKDDSSYQGFLQNLGSTVSATFVGENGITKPERHTEIEITPFYGDIDLGRLEPLEALASEPSKMSYTCRHCKKSFDSASYVKEHMTICEKFQNLQCYVCDVQKSCLKVLIAHVKQKHHNKNPPVKKKRAKMGKRTYTCKICGKVVGSRAALSYHMLHHKDKQFTCEECGRPFLTNNLLTNHKINAHQNETVEVCPICAKTFTYKNGLYSHMKLHSDELKYQCSICGKKFRFLGSKRSHELTHTGAKPYGCRFCEKHFTRHTSRNKHERSIHTGEKPFKCQFCDGAYVTKDYLTRHMMEHKGSFECFVCGKGLINAEILKLHLRKKHDITDQNQEDMSRKETVQESDENEYSDYQYQAVSDLYVD